MPPKDDSGTKRLRLSLPLKRLGPLPRIVGVLDRLTRFDEQARQVLESLDQVANQAHNVTLVLGGDDCLRSPMLEPLLLKAFGLGFRDTHLITPGSRLLEPGMIRFLLRCSVTEVTLTLHAASNDLFDRIVGVPGKGREAQEIIRELCHQGLAVRVNVVVVRQNLVELEDLLTKLASRRLPVNLISWYPDPYSNVSVEQQFAVFGFSWSEAVTVLARCAGLFAPNLLALEGFPPCALPEAILRTTFCNYTQPISGHRRLFRHMTACRNCALDRVCPGILSAYLDRYSEDEFIPPTPEASFKVKQALGTTTVSPRDCGTDSDRDA